MAATPTRLAQELADAASTDFSALERRKAEVDAKLSKLTPQERETFKSELTRLLRRAEIVKSKPSFKSAWTNGK